MKFQEFISLPSNVIDATVQQDKSRIIFSLDNYYYSSSSSTTTIGSIASSEEERASRPMLGCMSFDDKSEEDFRRIRSEKYAVERVEQSAKAQELTEDVDLVVMKRASTFRTLLYGVESLRKRAGQEDHD